MKKAISILILPLMIVGVLCIDLFFDRVYPNQEPKTYDTGYDEGRSAGYNLGHDEGYYEGYDEGYDIGANFAFTKVDTYVQDELIMLDEVVYDHHDLSYSNAMAILRAYANGESISETELMEAIEAIIQYNSGVEKIVESINHFSLD